MYLGPLITQILEIKKIALCKLRKGGTFLKTQLTQKSPKPLQDTYAKIAYPKISFENLQILENCKICKSTKLHKAHSTQRFYVKQSKLNFSYFVLNYCYVFTGSSCVMRISLLRTSLLRFFKTITKIWVMRFYVLFILLLRT